jgi:phenylpropionate dioxygenase-like ring-hydroxylating dioxygenase large terminal subunit
MLTKEENDLVTQTGPGTPGGAFMRKYWHPIALTSELPPGGAPKPVRILSEDLVLFRDDAGRAGLLGLLCAHRCTDLSYGRVENGGLRCLYHGWLFDIAGRVLEMPAEPPESTYKDKVRHLAYPCIERGGVIFAYLGTDEPPLLPNYEFFNYSEEHRLLTRTFLNCNWLQSLEGEIDPSHLSYLHVPVGKVDTRPVPGGTVPADQLYKVDSAPKLEVERTHYGMRNFSVRRAGPDKRYLRITNYILPHMAAIIGNEGRIGEGYSVHWHVPVDDVTHMRIDFVFNRHHAPNKEFSEATMAGEIRPDGFLVRNAANRYLQDRDEMKTKTFSGMGPYFPAQDAFATETPGPIHDRTREHLATSDVCITTARRLLIDAIRGVQKGETPPHVVRSEADNDMSDIAVISAIIPDSVDYRTGWRDATKTLVPR